MDVVDAWRCECDVPALVDREIGGQPLELLRRELGVFIRFAFWATRMDVVVDSGSFHTVRP